MSGTRVRTAPATIEQGLWAEGYRRIAGVDEVGRGCWAGPVVAAAVVLRPDVIADPRELVGINDSKQLSPLARTALLPTIEQAASAIGVGIVQAWLIDQIGIVAATRLAMEQAILSLPLVPDILLVDALQLPGVARPQHALVRGDSASVSIAAASIVAKTYRDRYMATLDQHFPHCFGQHKGYGTDLHRKLLRQHGITPLHRRSFRPLWEYREELSYDVDH